MQNINVNIVPDSYPQTIRYSQGDVGREFKINVVGFTIPTGATVKIQATKPSGFGFSVAGTVAGNAVSFTTTAIMTDEAGRFPAELEITKDSVVIGTANFIMWGEANPHPEGTTDGQQGTIIPELTLLVERVEAAASSVLDMEVVANTLPAGSQATYSYDEDLNKATFGIPQGEAGAGAAGVVADAYSSSKTYKVGDYVLHNSNLYRCTTAITTAEAFTAAHWTQIVLANDVSDLKSDLTTITGTSVPRFAEGYAILTNVNVGETVNLNRVTSSVHSCAVFDCTEGDKVLLNGTTSASYVYLWSFIDSSNKLLAKSESSITANDLVITAPQNTAKCIINLTTATMGECLYGKKILPQELSNIENDIDSLEDSVISTNKVITNNLIDENSILLEQTFINTTNGEISTNTQLFCISNVSLENVPVKPNGYKEIYCYQNDYTGIQQPRSVVYYDKDGDFISGVYQSNLKYNVPANAVKLTACFFYKEGDYGNMTKPSVYWICTDPYLYEEIEKEIIPNAVIDYKQVENAPFERPYIHTRRPTICFTLDKDYDLNETFKNVFEEHGIFIGFALNWGTDFTYFTRGDYLEWQKSGHEIMMHGYADLQDSATYTVEEAEQILRNGYHALTQWGFNIRGIVGSSGAIADRYMKPVYNLLEYGSTLNNHAGSYSGDNSNPLLLFNTNNPYRMFRYSMQLSTLAQQKSAVDEAIANNGLVIFYGHAQSTNDDYFTTENLEELLAYIESKGDNVQVLTPYEAVKDYYAVRAEDIIQYA